MGDVASKGTGGGLVSANTEGPTKFVGPGSLDVKVEGKNVQLLSDPMLNNCGGGGSPPNAATLLGILQKCGLFIVNDGTNCVLCGKSHGQLKETGATRANANTLAKNYKKESGVKSTMLGAARCKCKKRFAAQSGPISKQLCNAADKSSMLHPDPQFDYNSISNREMKNLRISAQEDIKERISRQANDNTTVTATFAIAQGNYQQTKLTNGSNGEAYPVGNCAAPKLLLQILENSHIPSSLTEQWYGTKTINLIGQKQHTSSGNIQFIDATNKGIRIPMIRDFKHGETVPPCKTCAIINPLLLCIEKDAECNQKK
jgi:hypothetical protein